MIKSMTAFAREQAQDSYGVISWEIRTVNHRYLDIGFKTPDAFRELEPQLRELISKYIKRGKIDCYLRFQRGADLMNDFEINTGLLKSLAEATETVRSIFDEDIPVDTMDLLRWPGALNVLETDMSGVHKAALKVFEKSLQTIAHAREREGAKLEDLLLAQLKNISKEISALRKHLPEILSQQRERLQTKLEEIKAEYDKDRFEQEMVYLAQRIDVLEELDRIEIHVDEIERILKKSESVGRRLDFLMQELNREANTLGSKSVSQITTKTSVELKVIIEQMREQIQNIE